MDSPTKNSQDLLRTTLLFKLSSHHVEKILHDDAKYIESFNLFKEVKAGKLTQINEAIQRMQTTMTSQEIVNLINKVDEDGKTALFYACYYNYQNIILYLLAKGADPFILDRQGRNCFFILAFKGLTDCINIIMNYLRHITRRRCLFQLKKDKRHYSFIKSDIQKGILVSPNQNLPSVKANFEEFMYLVEKMFKEDYLDQIYKFQEMAISQIDELNRTSVHYSAMSKYTRCNIATKLLLINKFNKMEGYEHFESIWNELQFLELNVERREETRSSLQVLELIENILSEKLFKDYTKDFKKRVQTLQRKIINKQDNDGYTPMHLSSFYGDFLSVQFLMGLGGDEHIRDLKGHLPVIDYASNQQVRRVMLDLKEAARRGDINSFDSLINCEDKNRIDERTTILTIAPVHNAVQHVNQTKKQDMLDFVIKCGANLDINDGSGWTPLHYACQNGDLDTVKNLVKNGANVNSFSNRQYYPIHIAALNNRPNIIAFIYDYGANVKTKDDEGCTPLLLAAKKGHVESIQVLLDLKADIYAHDIRGWTALHYASYNGHDRAVNLLCKYDADYEKLREMKNSQGKVAKEIASVDNVKFQFNTIWKAAYDGNLDILRRLHRFGEDLNAQTPEKRLTPLIIAAKRHHLLVVKYLLDNKVNTSLTDSDGKSAYQYASAALKLIKLDKNKKKIIDESKATKNEYTLTKDKKKEYFPDLVSRIEKTHKIFG